MAMRSWTDEVARANLEARQPVLFIPAAPPTSVAWDRWVETFESAGYTALTPAWPSEGAADLSSGPVARAAAHFAQIARALSSRPAVVGHAFGGRVGLALALDGLSAATVAIAPRPTARALLVEPDAPHDERGPMLVIDAVEDPFECATALRALAFIQRFV